MQILWTVFENAVNLYQSFLVIWFVYRFLGAKSEYGSRLYFSLAFALHFVLLTIQGHIGNDMDNWFTIGYFLINIIYACSVLKGSTIKKLFGSILPLMLLSVVGICVLDLESVILGSSIAEIVTSYNLTRFLVVMTVQISLYAVFRIVLSMLLSYNDDFHFKDWFMVIVIITLSFLLEIFLHNSLMMNIPHSGKLLLSFGLVILLMLDIIFFGMVKLMVEKNHRLKEMELIEVREQYHARYMDIAKQQYDSIRKIRHDMKHQLFAIRALLTQHQYDKAYDHLLKNEEVLDKMQPIVNTENKIFNAIINSKLSTAAAMGITVNCLSVKSFDGIDDIDLCNLVSNAIDNAIRSCSEQPSGGRITIDIAYENEVYVFNIKNTLNKSVLKNNPQLKSTKAKSEIHGYGTKTIKEIAKKYNGRCDFYEQDGMFCCRAMLQTAEVHPN